MFVVGNWLCLCLLEYFCLLECEFYVFVVINNLGNKNILIGVKRFYFIFKFLNDLNLILIVIVINEIRIK